MTTDMFRMYLITIFSAFMTYHQVYKKSSTTGAKCGAGIAYPSGAPEFTPYIRGVRIARSLVLCCSVVFICLFSFSHWVVCPCSIYDFWLPCCS